MWLVAGKSVRDGQRPDAALIETFAPGADLALYNWLVSESVLAVSSFGPDRVFAFTTSPLLQRALRQNRFLRQADSPVHGWLGDIEIPALPSHIGFNAGDLALDPYPAGSGHRRSMILQEECPMLKCRCGQAIPLCGDRLSCRCGAEAGRWIDGVAVVAPSTPYWGEIAQPKMLTLLDESKEVGWRSAVEKCLNPEDRERITDVMRAAFQDILPIPPNSKILDVGAGLGVIACELARTHRVTALEGVWERASFIAMRRVQDGLDNLTAVNGDLNSIEFSEGQFDVVVVNGVLEWVALFDLSMSPGQVQLRFMDQLRKLLTPEGLIYLAIENRLAWPMFLGAKDHSGIRYTSLMPRFLARWVCAKDAGYRSSSNTGYRTYTYSYWGYQNLFRKAGLRIADVYFAVGGYTRPTELVPIAPSPVRRYVHSRWLRHPPTLADRIRNWGKKPLANTFFWRAFGPNFAFLLKKQNA